MERGWTDLPAELLEMISSNLFAKDVQNFSLVCRSWYAAVERSFRRVSPCLSFYHNSKRMLKFYQHNRSFFMSFPELDSPYICSSNYGWLLMSRQDRTLFFFDPFNGPRTIELPDTMDDDYATIHFFYPPTSPKCFLIGIKVDQIEGGYGADEVPPMKIGILKRGKESWEVPPMKIGILKRGKESWESFMAKGEHEFYVSYSAPVLRNGVLYFVDAKGNVATLDVERVESSWTVHTKCLPFRRLRGKIRQHYLVKMEDDEAVYAVFLIHDVETVNVFRLSLEKMEWDLSQGCSFGHVLRNRKMYLSERSSFVDFNYFADCLFLPRFKFQSEDDDGEESDDILVYSIQAPEYQSYSLGHDGFSHSTSFGLRRMDFGVTWILPASPADFHLPSW